MGTVDDLVHKIFDQFPIFLHVPDVHMLSQLLALGSYIGHQAVELFLELRLFDVARQGKFEASIAFFCGLRSLRGLDSSNWIYFQCHGITCLS